MKETSTSGFPPNFRCSSTVSLPPEKACLLTWKDTCRNSCEINEEIFKISPQRRQNKPCSWSVSASQWGIWRSLARWRSSWFEPPEALGKTWSEVKQVWGNRSSAPRPGSSGNTGPEEEPIRNKIFRMLSEWNTPLAFNVIECERSDLTWSMAHGIRHWTSVLPLKIWGNEPLKDGAAWMAGKLIFPANTRTVQPRCSKTSDCLNSPSRLTDTITVCEAKDSFNLIKCDVFLNLHHVPVKRRTWPIGRDKRYNLTPSNTSCVCLYCFWIILKIQSADQ